MAYLDDILIFSKNETEHQKVVEGVLQALDQRGLQLKPEKCEFHQDSVEFLSFKISAGEIRMDESKVKAIWEWLTPTSLKGV